MKKIIYLKNTSMMKMMFNRYLFAILLCICACLPKLNAANEKYSTSASTKVGAVPALSIGTQLITRDAQYNRFLIESMSNSSTSWYGELPVNASGKFYDRNIKNRVVFSIDHTNEKFVSVPYSVTISFNVTYKKFVSGSFQSTTISKQLTINSNNTTGATSLDKTALEINGGNEMQVDVTNIQISPNTLSVNDVNLLLETEIDVERYYYFDASVQYNFLNLKHCSNDLLLKGELEINWQTYEGAEEYELEWLHINNYDGTTSGVNYNNLAAGQISFDEKLFELNSTRITTSNTFYKIPYVYERGYILYRLRPLGRTAINNWQYNIPGLWSTDFAIQSTIFNVSQFPNKFPDVTYSGPCNTNEDFISLHDHLNWQSNLSYAEEGKSKAVVSFADASLRNRQTVTKSKTQDDIIIGETVYDFQGRPVINFLPVPTDETKIAFVPDFNQYTAGVPYTKEIFDYDQSACISSAPAALNTIGAAKYYSENNSNVLFEENKYIPNAYGYAFTQTEYTPDNTGRIRNQSGLGPTYKLGSNHESKYLYGIPMQKDLDRLFGSEVGDNIRYKKTIVIDANGQASVSYLDPTGKTIATSLAGTPPSNVASLSTANSVLTTYDLLNKVVPTDNSGKSNLLDLDNKKLTMSASILVPANGPYTFTYNVVPPNYVENCGASIVAPPSKTITTTGTKCYSCVFDTKISLLNDCGQELFSNIIPASPANTNTFVAGTIDSICPVSAQNPIQHIFTPYNVSNSNQAWLQAGNYSLEKTLSINEDVLALYTRNYMDSLQNTCILKLSDFKAAQNLSVDLSGCGMSCETCITKLGSADTYTNTETCQVCLTMDEFNDLKAECEELCNNKSDKCENALVNLQADVSPTGQYGKYSPGGGSTVGGNIVPPSPNTVQPWLFPLSVYNESNSLPIRSHIKNEFIASPSYKFYSGIDYTPTWRNPFNPNETGAKKFAYLDDDGNIALIKLDEVDVSISDFLPKVHPWHFNKIQLINGEYFVQPRYLANVEDFIGIWETSWANSLVSYHPEYSFYEQCVLDQLSNDFDENLIEIDNVTDFKNYLTTVNASYSNNEYMYPVGTPPSSGTGPYSGIVVDPYFQSSGSGAGELSRIQLAMINYMENPLVPGTYISIWDAAYRIVNCPNAAPSGNICVMTAIPSGHVFNDEEWQTFKGMYASLKQSFQDRVTINNSISNGSYNQCIGADVFNPFDNRFYDPSIWSFSFPSWFSSFWSGFGWNFWPTLYTNSSQFYNPQQTCNAYKYHLYADMDARFPSAKMLMPDALANATPPCYDENNLVIPCPQSNSDVINEMGNQADLAAYTNCKQCPTSVNFEQLLKGLATYSTVATQQDLTNSTANAVKLTCAPSGSLHKEFTVELAQNLFGPTAPINHVYWQMDNTISSGVFLKGKFTYSGSPDCELFLEMPSHIYPAGIPGVAASYSPFINLYTFADVNDFCCVQYNATPFLFNGNTILKTGVGRFNAQVMVLTKTGDPLYISSSEPTYRKITLEGYASCVDFKNCNFQPVCSPSKEISHFQNLLNSLFFSNSGTPPISAAAYGTGDVDLNSVPYSGFFNPVLKDYLNNAYGISASTTTSWLFNKVSAIGSQYVGKLKPSPTSSQQCDIYIDLKPGSTYNATQIKRLTGIKPSTVTTAPSGAFTGYALLGNGTTSAWEVITGTVSCIDAGECSQEISSNFQLTGNSNDDPASLGLYNNCASSVLYSSLSPIINSGIRTYNEEDNTYTYTNPLQDGCKYVFSIPVGSNFDFENITALNSVQVSYLPGNFDVHNFTAVVTITAQPSPSSPIISYTVTLDGYSNCNIPINSDCIGACASPVNLIVNGDFEQGNVGFSSEYAYSPTSSLASINDTMALPYAASEYGKHYNVYNIKPIWSPLTNTFRSRNSDHTDYLTYNPISPPSILPTNLTGNGKALAVRGENTTYNSTLGILPSDIWSQQVNLNANNTYTFNCYITVPEGNLPINHSVFIGYVLINDVVIGYDMVTNFTANQAEGPVWKKIGIQIPSYYLPSSLTNAKLSFKGIFCSTNTSDPLLPTPNSDYLFLIDDISLKGCGGTSTPNSMACDIPAPFYEEAEDDCVNNAWNTAMEEAEYNYNVYLDSLRKNFQAKYIKKCLDVYEDFQMKCFDSEHHYTLYYYDEAGNLVRTVPPKGVNRIADNSPLLPKILLDRQNNVQTVFTEHTYATTYKYNSLNQLVSQTVPDNEDMSILKAQQILGVPSSQEVLSISYNGNNAVLTANDGTNGYLYTYDATTSSWVPITNLNLSNLNDVIFMNPTTIYAVGKNGTITKTADGGVTWNFVSFPDATIELMRIVKNPLAVGEVLVYDIDGNLWTSSGALSSWAKTTNVIGLAVSEKLIDVKFNAGFTNGWAITNQNRIFNFDGTNWIAPINNIRTASLSKVTGNVGSTTVYAVGKDGTLLKSLNNGSSWSELLSSMNLDIIDAEFLNDYKGAFVTSGGSLLATFDGGLTFVNASSYSSGLSGVVSISIDKTNAVVYATTQLGAVKSFNLNTLTWTSLSSASSSGLTYNVIKAVGTTTGANPKLLIAGNQATLKSYDFVNNIWTPITTSPVITSGETILSMDLKLNGVGNAQGYLVSNANNVFTFDQGNSSIPIAAISIPGLATGTQLKSICAKTHNSAYLVGTKETIVSINNITPSILSSSAASSLNLKSVYTNSGGYVIAVGDNSIDQLGQIVYANSSLAFNNGDNITPPQLSSISETASGSFICGADGTVLRYNTTNNTWETLITNSNTLFTSLSVSSSNIVVSGKKNTGIPFGEQILYSTNYGNTWNSVANTQGNMVSSQFIGADVYFVGDNKLITKSTFPPTSGSFNLITTSTPASTDKFLALASDGTNIKIVGENGLIFGGNTSSSSAVIESNFNPPILNDIKWFDASHIIAVGNNGKILVSENAGTSWRVLSGPVNQKYNAVEIFDATTAFVVGENNTYFEVTSCPGLNCTYGMNLITTPSTSNPTINYKDISINNGSIMVVSADGRIFYKNNTSGFVEISPSPAVNQLNAVHLVDPAFAYAVGNNGNLVKINPSSLSAIKIDETLSSFSSSSIFNHVYFKDLTTGYLLGDNGIASKTTNGGLTWNALPGTNVAFNYNVIASTNNYHNYLIGGTSGIAADFVDYSNEISSRFYYDKLGRLVVSQNSKQFAQNPKTYSYTKYDVLGRIVEVGEVKAQVSVDGLPNTNNAQISLSDYATWLTNAGNVFTEITKTVYDYSVTLLPSVYDGSGTFSQNNIRNRVSYTTYQDVAGTTINHATYYSYDIHGNVTSLYQYNPALAIGNKFKRTEYDYDLISGKVNLVKYQYGAKDQFQHKYEYDADNRITNVFTSKDNVIWDQDAKYFYYKHGPLSRVEIGDQKVQGLDYAYTLQGWIKGVNSDKLTEGNDMGADAKPLVNNTINSFVSRDAVGYSLGYHNADYSAIIQSSSSAQTTDYFLADNSSLASTTNELFNGNISSMTKSIKQFMDGNGGKPQVMLYNYDQLNRLVGAASFENFDVNNNEWNAYTASTKYKEYFKYDDNGNIERLKRYDGLGNVMDSLTYRYNTIATGVIKNTNKLGAAQDAITTLIADDIESGQVFNTSNHSLDNYQYDNIGNLIKDDKEEIADIKWTVYGKIKQIIRKNTSIKSDLEFNYDASGNRISKIEKTKVSAGVLNPSNLWNTTYYTRDAQGNTMATYEQSQATLDVLKLKEQHLYGSSRLGVLNRDENMTTGSVANEVSIREAGKKLFELSNHLGNVLTVVSDKKVDVSGNCSALEFDGDDDLVKINHNSNYNFGTGDFTIEARIKASSSQTDPYPSIMSNRSSALGFGSGFVFYYLNGKITMYMNGNDVVSTTADMRDNLWHHVAVNRSSGNVTLYVDGVSVASATSAGDINTGYPMWVGIEEFGPTLTAFKGNINEVRLWNIAKTQVDINNNKNIYLTGSESGLVGYWRLNEGANQVAGDFTANSNNSILGSTSGTELEDPIWSNVSCFNTNANKSFVPDVISATDYYSFGSPMPGRQFNGNDYRYGMNTQEKDNEIFEGAYSAEFWEYDSRLGRRWNIDPEIKDWESPYATFANNPIWFTDLNGRDSTTYIFGSQTNGKNDYTVDQLQKIADASKKVDMLNGIDYTKFKVFANQSDLEASIKNGESSFNPITDQFFEISSTSMVNSEGYTFGDTYTAYTNRLFVNETKVQGGRIFAGTLSTYAANIGSKELGGGNLFYFNLGLILNHERVAHGYPSASMMLLGLSRGSSPYEGHFGNGIEMQGSGGHFYFGNVKNYKLRISDTYDAVSKNNVHILFISGFVAKQMMKNIGDASLDPKNPFEIGVERALRKFLDKNLKPIR